MSNEQFLRQMRAIFAKERSWTEEECAHDARIIHIRQEDALAIFFRLLETALQVFKSDQDSDLMAILALLDKHTTSLLPTFASEYEDDAFYSNHPPKKTNADVLHVIDLAIEETAQAGT